jgi:hypothetical protein
MGEGEKALLRGFGGDDGGETSPMNIYYDVKGGGSTGERWKTKGERRGARGGPQSTWMCSKSLLLGQSAPAGACEGKD